MAHKTNLRAILKVVFDKAFFSMYKASLREKYCRSLAISTRIGLGLITKMLWVLHLVTIYHRNKQKMGYYIVTINFCSKSGSTSLALS